MCRSPHLEQTFNRNLIDKRLIQTLCAAARCVVQLTILGYVLVPIFTFNRAELSLAYACVMLAVGAYEAVSRPAFSYTVRPPPSGKGPTVDLPPLSRPGKTQAC